MNEANLTEPTQEGDELDDPCQICGSRVVFTEFNGNWKVFSCLEDDCSYEIQRYIGDSSEETGEGYTIESLRNVNSFDV